MGKALKITLSVISGLVVLILIAVTALFLFVDPNNFKQEIEAAVNDNTGRKLAIEGDLNLTIFPWIGISTGKMTLSNAPGFTDHPFAAIESSNIKVSLLPLFKQELEVSRILLKGLQLNLEKDKQGITNWEDLSKSEKQSAPTPANEQNKPSEPPLAFLAVGGFAIENARIVWDDQQSGKYNEINDFNLHSESIQFDQPAGIDLSFIIVGKQPTQKQSVSLTTDLTINEALNSFRLDKLKLESVTEGGNVPGGKLAANISAEISLNLAEQTALIKDLRINSEDLIINAELTGTNIVDKPVFKGPISIEPFNPRKLMQQLEMELPSMQDSTALTQFSMQFNLLADTESVAINKINMAMDSTQLTGSASIKNFSHPAYAFDLDINALNVDRYLPEKQQAEPPKVDKPSQAASTPATVVTAGTTLIPVDTLRKLGINGQLAVGILQVSKVKMQGVQLNVSANKGLLKTNQTITNLYKGTYKGSINIDVTRSQPSFSLNENISQLQIGPLLQDRNSKINMTGTASGSAKLLARGNSIENIKSSLNGPVSFVLKDGVIKGFNLQKIINNGTSLLTGKPLPASNSKDQTAFSIISGNINFKNGIAVNDDLLAKAPNLRVTGKGEASLTTEKIDYSINSRLIKSAATATKPEIIEGIPVYINIRGTFSEPVYAPDIVAMLKDKSNPEIEKKKQKLLDKVEKEAGPEIKNILKKLF